MSRQPARLSEGGLIDRAQPINFSFDGRRYEGFAGDTLASALLANGVHHVARSFKYHRPRGILGAGSEDPGALVRVGSDPATMVVNQRATEVELHDGLEAFPQNCWPSLRFDIGGVNDLMHRFLSAGFYYKTFMGPPGSWMFFEPFIRRVAGLGPAPSAPDPARYEHVNRHCEVLVIGAGPAGLAAAREAARSGARVILAEESPTCGGRILAEAEGDALIEGLAPRAWCAAVLEELAAHPEVTLLTRTSASGYYAQNWLTLFENCTDHLPLSQAGDGPRHRLWRVRAQQVVLATGAIERPLVFNGNDRPGIMLASAARTFLHRYGVRPGDHAAIFTNNDDAWQSAFDLHDAGARIAAIIDTRPDPAPAHREAAQARGIPVRLGATILATQGRRRIRSIDVAAFDGAGGTGKPERIACDLLCVSGGWSPNVALFSQSGGSLRYDETLAAFVPDEARQAVVAVGACAGDFALSDAVSRGAEAGQAAAGEVGFVADATDNAAGETRDGSLPYRVTPAWELPSNRPKTRIRAFVDHQNDVTAKDLHLAVREGYGAVEHAKRYTTTGMGTDQGKTVGVNAIGVLSGVLSGVLDKPIGEIGVTTFRPPWKPISFGAVAGQHVGALFHPRRTTPMHDWHAENGAVFEIVSDWLRARVYPRPGEDFEAALQRECRAARNTIGVLDASTLGKIDIRGKDSRTFLNRIYSNAWMKLEPGRCRYGLMTNEDGMVFDDGVTACLGDDHFHMTTTT
ncbi:MAG: 2Fe-2S iron-sulfur cluster-binding protein, partial [Salinarimonas sp.]